MFRIFFSPRVIKKKAVHDVATTPMVREMEKAAFPNMLLLLLVSPPWYAKRDSGFSLHDAIPAGLIILHFGRTYPLAISKTYLSFLFIIIFPSFFS